MLDANDKKLVTESLWKKIAESGDTNIVGIGFGIAVKEGNTDLTRPWVVRFYVKQKRGGRHKFKITPEITVDIEPKYAASDGGKRKVTLLTDVTKVPTIEPAGRKLTIPGNGLVTSGIVLRWYKASGGATANQTLRLGVLTVAHDFKGIDPNRMVTIESPNNLLQPITGKRAIQSDPAKVGIDACLVTVEVDEAIKAGLLTDPLASPLPIKQYADLEDDRDKTGESRQADRTVSFRVLGTVGNLPVKMSGLKYGICYMSRAHGRHSSKALRGVCSRYLIDRT